jgi:hypothetical protein
MRNSLISNKDLLVVVLLTIFYLFTGFTPNPLAWPNQISYRIDLTQTIQPENPLIEQLEVEFTDYFENQFLLINLDNYTPEEKKINAIETFIWSKIPYVTDFNNYFAWEYFPSISEVIERGDDCDGISIITSSLLTRMGYENYVVLGKWHSWVEVNLRDGKIINLYDSRIHSSSNWYIKYNSNNIYIHEISLLDVILHNFLLILFFEKLMVTLFIFFRRYDAFQTVYATLIALLLSPLPVLVILMSMNM